MTDRDDRRVRGGAMLLADRLPVVLRVDDKQMKSDGNQLRGLGVFRSKGGCLSD